MLRYVYRLRLHVRELARREPGLGAGHEDYGRDGSHHGRQHRLALVQVVRGALCAGIPGHEVLLFVLWIVVFTFLFEFLSFSAC